MLGKFCMLSLVAMTLSMSMAFAQSSANSGSEVQATLPGRIRVGGNVQAKQLRHMVPPVYPPIAQTAHIQGTVVLHEIVGVDGAVKELQYVSGPPLLMRAAMDAVKQWIYQPTLLNGKPVEVDTTVEVQFAIAGGRQPATGPATSTLHGEEILLKDGSKIFGKIIGVKDDKFKVQLQFSKIEIPQSEIVSIMFRENQSEGETAASAPPSSSESAAARSADEKIIQQSLTGTTYTNGAAHFTLTIPEGWKTNDALARKVPDGIGGISSSDTRAAILIQDPEFGGSAKEFAQLFDSMSKATFEGYEKLSESSTQIDGESSELFIFRAVIALGATKTQAGTSQPAETTVKVPIKYLVAIVPESGRILTIMCSSAEVSFNDFEPIFEKILGSYRGISGDLPAVKP